MAYIYLTKGWGCCLFAWILIALGRAVPGPYGPACPDPSLEEPPLIEPYS